jgi:hypothetical protein
LRVSAIWSSRRHLVGEQAVQFGHRRTGISSIAMIAAGMQPLRSVFLV